MSDPLSLEGATDSILVPVNFAPAARAALVFGAQLAKASGAPLTILHVVHEPGDWPNYYRRYGGSEASLPIDVLAERRLEEFLAEVRRLNAGLSALETSGILLVKGLPATRIPEVARRLGAAHIVIGHTRARRLAPGLFASLSARVADRCDIPVTAVRPDGRSEVVNMPPRPPLDDGTMALGA
jgi:nucleotide-binding universal stress UspA family protein